MIRPVVVLRPQPGNRATVDRLHNAGLPAIALPLFDVSPLSWEPPGPGPFDGLILTSANAIRHGGPGIDLLTALPVHAVGATTAAAARAAGFAVRQTGQADLAALLQSVEPGRRMLWLSGKERTAIEHPAIALTIPVYRAAPLAPSREQAERLPGAVALLHSARAAALLNEVIDAHRLPRAAIRIAAISAKVAAAAGPGWARSAIAATPTDDALIATAGALAIDP